MLLSVSPAVGQSEFLTAALTDSSSTVVSPGEVATVAVRVSNASDRPVHLTPQIELPDRWRAVLPVSAFTLPADTSVIRLISVAVPGNGRAGGYSAEYTVQDRSGTAFTCVEIPFDIPMVRSITLRRMQAPRFAASGESYTSTFQVMNAGNDTVTVLADVDVGGDGFVVHSDSLQVELGPAQSETIPIVVQAPADLSRQQRHALTLRVSTREDASIQERASSHVNIIPRQTSTQSIDRWMPLSLTVSGVGEGRAVSPQAELSGILPLSSSSSRRIEVLARGPEVRQGSVFGRRDEYRLNYVGEHFDLRLGDNRYSLSRLTEYSARGLGAALEARPGDFTLGTYVQRARYATEEQGAGYLRYDIGPGLQLGANYLLQRGREEGQMTSVEVTGRPLTNTEVVVEYARALEGGSGSDAVSARAYGRQGRFNYTGRYIHTGRGYPGYSRATDYKTASLGVRVGGRFRLEGQASDRTLTPQLAVGESAPRHNTRYRIGGRYGNAGSLFYEYTGRREMPQTNRREQGLRLTVSPRLQPIRLQAQAEVGRTADLVVGDHYPYQEYRLTSGITPASGRSLQLSGSYARGRSLYDSSFQQQVRGTLSAYFRFGSHFQTQTTISHSWTERAGRVTNYASFNLRAEYTFPFEHQLSLRLRQSLRGSSAMEMLNLRERAGLYAAYTVPFSVPAGRRSDIGQLQGRIVDRRTGRGMDDVVLYMADRAVVSGEDGQFAFANLDPGTYRLRTDPSSLGPNQVLDHPQPVQVSIRGGETATLELGVIPGATVVGEVVRYDFEGGQFSVGQESQELTERGGLADVAVVMERGQQRLRHMTDAGGRVSFSGLQSGEWTISAASGRLPPHHYLETDTVRIDLGMGEERDVRFEVLPRRRNVRMQEGGVLTPGQSAGEADSSDHAGRVSEPRTDRFPITDVEGLQDSKYFIQLGAFSTTNNAQQFAVRAKGTFGGTVQVVHDPARGLYLVLLPAGAAREHAEQVLSRVRAEADFSGAFLFTAP